MEGAEALLATVALNRASSGTPAAAALRSRTATRSVNSAASPMPQTARKERARRPGTGGANRAASAQPRLLSRTNAVTGRQTSTGSGRIRVSEATPATTITAPTPSQNHVEEAMSGCSAMEAATAAAATIAASIALHPLIASSTWFWEGVGAVIVVAGVASLTRIRPLPVLVCLPVTAFGLLLYVNLVFSRQHSFGGVLPT